MTNIHVRFPANGSTPEVIEDIEAVVSEHNVTWHIDCANPRIEKIEIEFDKPMRATEFFRERPEGPYKCEKHLKRSPAYLEVWGTAPKTGQVAKRQECKYTIRGFTKDDTIESAIELDPMILTTDP